MKRKGMTAFRLCTIGLMMALYYILAKMTIPLGNVRITLAPLPIVILAMLYGPADASIAALLGEFLIQATGRYGLTPTTPLWCLPPVFRAVIVGCGYMMLTRKQYPKDSMKYGVLYFACMILGAIATTLGNTAVTWADSVVFNYYSFGYVFGDFVVRLVLGIATAAAVGIIAQPIVDAVKKIPIARKR